MMNSRIARVAIIAVAVVVTLIALAIRNARSQTAEFVVPTNEAALILMFELPNLPGMLTVSDASDTSVWRSDITAPRLQQIRLRPGDHRLRIDDREELIHFAGGTWTLLTIAGASNRAGYDVRRRQINLAGNQYAGSSLSDFVRRHTLAASGYRPVHLMGYGTGMRITLQPGL